MVPPEPIPQQQPAGHETLEQLNELMRFDGDVDDQGNGFGDNEDDEAQKDASKDRRQETGCPA